MTRIVALLLWAALIAEAALLSPTGPGLPDWVRQAINGDWSAHNPLVIAHFMLMGVWPLVLTSQTARAWATRPVPLLPFALGTMVLGAFILLPGIALVGTQRRALGRVGRAATHPVVQAALAAMGLGLLGWGLIAGEVEVWRYAFLTDPFLHIMAFDSLAVWLTSILLAWQERDEVDGWAWTLLPLFGTTVWTARMRAQALSADA